MDALLLLSLLLLGASDLHEGGDHGNPAELTIIYIYREDKS